MNSILPHTFLSSIMLNMLARLLIIFLAFNIHSNDEILKQFDKDFILGLSDEQKQNLAEQFNESEKVDKEVETKKIESLDPSEQFDFYQEKFGYDFFNKVPTTISPTQDLPVPNDYKLSLSDEMQIILSGNKNITYSLEVNRWLNFVT